MESSKNQEDKVIFLYSPASKDLITEKDFSLESNFPFKCEKEIKEEDSTILLLSSNFDLNKLKSNQKYTILLQKKYQSNEFQLFKGENFLFNIVFQPKISVGFFSWGKKEQKPPEIKKISDREQYKYFVDDYIKKNNLQKSHAREALNRDVVKLFTNPFDFAFYLDVFKDVFSSKFIKNLLAYFKIEKMIFPENLNPKTHSALMKLFLKKGKTIIDKVQGNKLVFAQKLYIILLYYFYYFVPNSLKEMLDEGKGECNVDYYDLFIENEKIFTVPNDNSLEIIFYYIKRVEDIICLMKKFSKFYNCLKSIHKNIDKISELCEKEKKNLNINDIPKNPEEEKLNEILSILNDIKNMENEKHIKILSLDLNFWKQIISNCGNEKNDLDKLMEIFSENEDEMQKELKPLIEDKQHEICQKAIIQSQDKNKEILEWVSMDPMFKRKKGTDDQKKDIDVILKKIDFEELNKNSKEDIESFFNILKELKLKEILPNDIYINFCNGLIDKIKRFESFNYIYEFIDFEDKEWKILNVVHRKYLELINQTKGKNEKFQEITNKYLSENMKIGYINEIEEILSKIEEIFDKENIKILYMNFIEVFIGNEKLTSRLVKYFSGNLKKATDAAIKVLLNGIKNENALKQLFKDFKDLTFSEDEFFQKEENENIKILRTINEFGYIKSGYLDGTEYYKIISELSNSIIQKLKEYNFDSVIAKTIKNLGKDFEERLNIINFSDTDINYSLLIEKINNYLTWEDKISEINKFMNFFSLIDEEIEKRKVNELNQDFNQKNVNEILKKETEINNIINEYYEKAKEVNELHQSEFFNSLFKKYKEDEEKDPLGYAIEDFESLEDLFDDKKFSEIKPEIFNLILKEIKSKEFLEKEFKFLKKHFKKEDLDTSFIESQLMILS